MKQRWRLDAQRGMDRAALNDSERKKIPEVSHPIVRPHPITGRPALYVNEGFTVRIEGLPEDESQALLAQLFSHSTQDRFTYIHQWQANDLIMWDNACIIHSATWYDPQLFQAYAIAQPSPARKFIKQIFFTANSVGFCPAGIDNLI